MHGENLSLYLNFYLITFLPLNAVTFMGIYGTNYIFASICKREIIKKKLYLFYLLLMYFECGCGVNGSMLVCFWLFLIFYHMSASLIWSVFAHVCWMWLVVNLWSNLTSCFQEMGNSQIFPRHKLPHTGIKNIYISI